MNMDTIKADTDIKTEVDDEDYNFSEEIFIDSPEITFKSEEVGYDHDFYGDIVQVDKIIFEILSTVIDNEENENFNPVFKTEIDDNDAETKVLKIDDTASQEEMLTYCVEKPNNDVKQYFTTQTEDVRLHQGVKNTGHSSGPKNHRDQHAYLKSETELLPNAKTHQCPICEVHYYRRENMTAHMAFHNPQRPFQCYHCKKYYTTKKSVRLHIQLCHSEKLFHCFVCFKPFSLLTRLRIHTRSHTGEKAYECNLCDTRFPLKCSFKSHVKAHFKGNALDYAAWEEKFAKITDLQSRNTKTHTKKTRMTAFSCPTCNARLSSIGRFKRHMSNVHGELRHNAYFPYACQMCPKNYTDGSSLRRHFQNRHANETQLLPALESLSKTSLVTPTTSSIVSEKTNSVAADVNTVNPKTTSLSFAAAKDCALFSCSTCGDEFAFAEQLRAHGATHITRDRPERSRTHEQIQRRQCLSLPVLEGPFETISEALPKLPSASLLDPSSKIPQDRIGKALSKPILKALLTSTSERSARYSKPSLN